METIFERIGALDVHQAQVTAGVRVPDAAGTRKAETVEFATTVRGLLGLADWLEAFGVTKWRWRRPACIGCRSGTSSRRTSS